MSKIIDAQLLPSQSEFIRSKAKKTLFLGGIGCVDKDTLIDTDQGQFPISNMPKEFKYKVFNGIDFSYAKGSAPFPKGHGKMYEVVTQEGTIIVYEKHEFFCSDQTYRNPAQLLRDSRNGKLYALFSTKSENFPYNLYENIYLILDRVFKYIKYYCHYPKSYQNIYNVLFAGQFRPELNQIINFLSKTVEAIEKNINIFSIRITNYNSISHPLQGEKLVHFYNNFANNLAHLAFDLLPEINHKNIRKKEIRNKINECIKVWETHDFRYSPTDLSCNKIVDIKEAGERVYWDTQIPVFNNYVAHGIIHHNSGKTTAHADFILSMIKDFPKAIGLITANTYSQLINSTVEAIQARFYDLNIPSKVVSTGSRKRLQVLRTEAKLYSLENYNIIRGTQAGWWLSDESAFSKKEAIDVCRGRMRDKNGPLYERHTSTGNGFNWLYDEFEYKDDKKKLTSIT